MTTQSWVKRGYRQLFVDDVLEQSLGVRHAAFDAVNDEHRSVAESQAAADLVIEVGVAGSVDDVD